MVDMAHYAGLVAAGLHNNPVPVADFVTTTTHKTLRGPRAGMVLCKSEYAQGVDKTVFPGMQGGPLMHVIAGKAVCFAEALKPEFKDYARRSSPTPRRWPKCCSRRAEARQRRHRQSSDAGRCHAADRSAARWPTQVLEHCGITVNMNMIPFDTRKPLDPSGIRIGTPALTTRGMGVDEMRQIGRWMLDALEAPGRHGACSSGFAAKSAASARNFPFPRRHWQRYNRRLATASRLTSGGA